MDWTDFMFGALTGSFLTLTMMSALAWRWVRPFMRAAQRKAERAASGESVAPPIYWQRDTGSTSNEPTYVWPPSKGKSDGD